MKKNIWWGIIIGVIVGTITYRLIGLPFFLERPNLAWIVITLVILIIIVAYAILYYISKKQN